MASKQLQQSIIRNKIVQQAQAQGIDPNLALALVQQESGFNPNAKSGVGAMGLFQLMPATAKGLGVDPSNVDDNIKGGVTYLSQLLKKYKGDVQAALANYNGGPGAVTHLRKTGYKYNPNASNNSWDKQTAGYVKSVMANYNNLTKDLPFKTNVVGEVAQGLGQGLSAGLYQAPQQYQSKPATLGASLLGQLGTVVGANAVAPGVGAIAALGAQGAGNEYRRQFDEVGAGTRQNYSGGRIAASAGANALLGLLPVSAPGNLIQRAVSGAALGGGGNLAANVAGNIIDPNNQRNPLEGVGEGAALGGTFGAAFGARRPSTTAPVPQVETPTFNPGSNNAEQMRLNLYSELPPPSAEQTVQGSIVAPVDGTQQGNILSNQYTPPPMPENYGMGSPRMLPEFSTAEAQMLPQGQVLVGGQDGLVPSQPVGDLGIIQQQLQPEPLLDNTQQQVLPLEVSRPLESPIATLPTPLADQLGTMPTPRVNEGLSSAIQTPDLVADSLPGPGQQMMDFSRPPVEIQPLSPYDAGTYVKPPQLKQQFTNVENGRRVNINFNNPVEVAMSNMTKGKTISKPDLAYLKQAIPGATDEQLISIAKRYRKEVINKTIKTGEPIPEAALQDLVNQETLATKAIPVESPKVSKTDTLAALDAIQPKPTPEPEVNLYQTIKETQSKEVLPEASYKPLAPEDALPEGAIRITDGSSVPGFQKLNTPDETLARLLNKPTSYEGRILPDPKVIHDTIQQAIDNPDLAVKLKYYTDIKGHSSGKTEATSGIVEKVVKPYDMGYTANAKRKTESSPKVFYVNDAQQFGSAKFNDFDTTKPAGILSAELIPNPGIKNYGLGTEGVEYTTSSKLREVMPKIAEVLKSLPVEKQADLMTRLTNIEQPKIGKHLNYEALQSLSPKEIQQLAKELGC